MPGKTNLDLYRSVRKEQFPKGTVIKGVAAAGLLYPDFYKRELPSGDIRPPDVDLVEDEEGTEWVKSGGGTSLFDRANVFKGKSWLSFTIPEGTVVPDSLTLPKTGYNKRFRAWHYQIEARAKLMQKSAFQGALDNLARNAIVRAVELASVDD